jgi:redox-sensing transcriptional repressor
VLVKKRNKDRGLTDAAAQEARAIVRDVAEPVSELTTNRLSVYLRCLNVLDASGVRAISSQAMAEQFHLNASQIRKDLAYFGEFGVRGVGYYVKQLRSHLRQILGLDRRVRVAIMGAGNLGMALADYPGFRGEGFEIASLFDTTRDKIGQRSRGGVPIHDVRDFERIVGRQGITIAVIAVPAEVAQAVVNTAVAAGLKAILNFSPGTLKVPPDVKLKSVDLTVSLESLSFFLAQGEGPAVRAATRAEPPREGDAPRLLKKKTRRDQKTTTVGEITSFPH